MNEGRETCDEATTTGDAKRSTLAWPPRKEDLERLYLVERLSAMKIANAYGLKYASPKTAESTILYQLKRNGITRRSPVEHIAKVTEAMVDLWMKRYQAGESLAQIAGHEVSSVTIFLHLRRRGIQLRDREEAKLKAIVKYEKQPFSGDSLEKAYLLGFVCGDCAVVRHGNAVRVRTGTTHPLMARHFLNTFGSYGRVHLYPRLTRLVGAEWNLEVDLDRSFDFLFGKDEPLDLTWNNRAFLSFLGGFVDAEGSIYLHRKRFGNSFEIQVANTNEMLLRKMSKELDKLGIFSQLSRHGQHPNRLGYFIEGEEWHLHVWRNADVIELLSSLNLKHPEKVSKSRLALKYMMDYDVDKRQGLVVEWGHLIQNIRLGRDRYVNAAKLLIQSRSAAPDAVPK